MYLARTHDRVIMATQPSLLETLLMCVASFGSLSLVNGEGTITVFRNTLDRATSGARGGATLVRASGAAAAPARRKTSQN